METVDAAGRRSGFGRCPARFGVGHDQGAVRLPATRAGFTPACNVSEWRRRVHASQHLEVRCGCQQAGSFHGTKTYTRFGRSLDLCALLVAMILPGQ
jgi:hypothetical protein